MCSYSEYKFIYKPEYHVDEEDVMTTDYSKEELLSKFVVVSGKYRVYNKMQDFLADFEEMSESEKTFHEVIFDKPQKIKFDIDAEVADLCNISAANNDERYKRVRNNVLFVIVQMFASEYAIEIDPRNIIICESDSDESSRKKYSTHIILDKYYVSNSAQAKEFTRRVAAHIFPDYKRFLDMNVNKSVQNFRIAECHKSGDDRVKVIKTNHDIEDTFITNISGCKKLDDIITTEKKIDATMKLSEDEIEEVLAICSQDSELSLNHRFRNINNGNMFNFDRTRGSYCDFCNRVHARDNTHIVLVLPRETTMVVYKMCRTYGNEHAGEKNCGKLREIGKLKSCSDELRDKPAKPLKTTNKIADKWTTDAAVQKAVFNYNKGDVHLPGTLFDALPAKQKHSYSSPQISPLELAHTLVVRAHMKMGKTKALVNYLADNFDNKIKSPVVRIVSFRQTFGNDIKKKFPGFVLYSDVKSDSELTDDKLIIQVESLYRLRIWDGDETPDLLILDECESIFEQFNSGLLRGNFNDCFAKFAYLLKFSKHVVCMDAAVGDRTYRILDKIRPNFREKVLYHINTYKNATDDTYYFCGDVGKWYSLLYTAIEEDDKIVIPISSCAEGKGILAVLQEKYPDKVCKLYSADTSQSEKKEHFSNVNLYWKDVDVLIYTPTITAGISFEKEHFTKVFAYFTDASCGVEICMQMIGRVRDIASRSYYVYLSGYNRHIPCNTDDIKEALYSKRWALMTDFGTCNLTCEYNQNGTLTYSGDYFQLWLENASIHAQSKNMFVPKFILFAAQAGAKIQYISVNLYEQLSGKDYLIDGDINGDVAELVKIHKTARSYAKKDLQRCIANAPEISDDEAARIKDLMDIQADITWPERFSYRKHKLRAMYQYEGVIDEKFVARFYETNMYYVYRNLTKMNAYKSVEETLKAIQAEEFSFHRGMMLNGQEGEQADLNKRYIFNQHRLAIGYLQLCGFADIDDQNSVFMDKLVDKLIKGSDLYHSGMVQLHKEFEIKIPAKINPPAIHDEDAVIEYITNMLTPINKILRKMYGICIKPSPYNYKNYKISQTQLFTKTPQNSLLRRIPLIR